MGEAPRGARLPAGAGIPQVSGRYPAGRAAGIRASIRAGTRQYPGEYRAAPACQYRSIAGPLPARCRAVLPRAPGAAIEKSAGNPRQTRGAHHPPHCLCDRLISGLRMGAPGRMCYFWRCLFCLFCLLSLRSMLFLKRLPHKARLARVFRAACLACVPGPACAPRLPSVAGLGAY